MRRACFILLASSLTAFAQDARLEHFEKKVRPVFAAQCFACHSKAAPQPQGGLSLDSSTAIQRGGNSGALFLAGDPDHSLLVRALRHTDKALKMPPGQALPAETVADIEQWIRQGAPLPTESPAAPAVAKKPALWSLKAPQAVAPPPVKKEAWARNDVDRFVLATLEAKGLQPSAEASKETLIRRVSFDLTGLPPTAEQVEMFLADRSPNAYETLVNRLLDSPQYGERYARHWLDVARYADSVNDSVNAGQRYPWSYTYRDWVIRAFNEDLPYNQFVLYQLAADRVSGVDQRHLAALGYLSLGREFPKSFPETVDDRIDAVGRGFLGLTVACARCHDHKYDPISAKDYYSLYSVLANIRTPAQFPLLKGAAENAPKQATYEQRLEKIQQDYQEYRKRRHAEMVAFFQSHSAEYQQAAKDAGKLSNAEVEELARDRQLNLHVLNRWRQGLPSPSAVPLEEFELIYTEGDSNNSRSLRNRYNTMLALSAYDGAPPRAMAIEDVPKPEPVHVFVRGNPNNPGALAPPRMLSCLGGDDAQPFREGSGRLELARAIIDPGNPLTARVMVNRVWMHHFGAGLVRTPSDFGVRGEVPTHPELLDYLAVKFVEGGWSIKKLHRMIMTSATYRQAVADNAEARAVDPENLLLWRMNRRRLDIESLRDAMLAATGRLERDGGGPPFSLLAQPFVPRRSVYGFIERGRVPAMLSAFDFASPDQHAPMRHVTTVPQQALFFLNSPFVAEQARQLTARAEAGSPEERIQLLYRYALGRKAAPWEVEAGLRFLTQTKAKPEAPAAPSAWSYGTGSPDAFRPFSTFDADRWQGAAALPAAQSGKALLRATGGEPGEGSDQAVIRRWTSPAEGTVVIEGTLRHAQPAVPFGDGVRARIVSSRHGELASWIANGTTAETKLGGVKVEAGDTIDFLVDSRQDPENDGFNWAPQIKLGEQTWNAKEDFAGPAVKPLAAWERYAQVLFETIEFAFVD